MLGRLVGQSQSPHNFQHKANWFQMYRNFGATYLSICLYVCLFIFSEVFKTLNYFQVNFSPADAVHRYYTGFKIILYRLLDIHTKQLFLSVSKCELYFLTCFRLCFQELGCSFGKTDTNYTKRHCVFFHFLPMLSFIVLRD